ncbi:MAG: hypothetical protein JHD35_26815, partial [Sphingopyxis sp.]|nr:hypothetical protein [Sphingopyxis sp.]
MPRTAHPFACRLSLLLASTALLAGCTNMDRPMTAAAPPATEPAATTPAPAPTGANNIARSRSARNA